MMKKNEKTTPHERTSNPSGDRSGDRSARHVPVHCSAPHAFHQAGDASPAQSASIPNSVAHASDAEPSPLDTLMDQWHLWHLRQEQIEDMNRQHWLCQPPPVIMTGRQPIPPPEEETFAQDRSPACSRAPQEDAPRVRPGVDATPKTGANEPRATPAP